MTHTKKNRKIYLNYFNEVTHTHTNSTHLLYKFTFVEAFPQQLLLDDTCVSSIRVSNLFLHKKHNILSRTEQHT